MAKIPLFPAKKKNIIGYYADRKKWKVREITYKTSGPYNNWRWEDTGTEETFSPYSMTYSIFTTPSEAIEDLLKNLKKRIANSEKRTEKYKNILEEKKKEFNID